MDDKWALSGVSRDQIEPGPGKPAAQPVAAAETLTVHKVNEAVAPARRGGNLVSIVVGVIGLAALGTSAWVYAQTQRDIKRVATDIAQIRLSLELYGKQQPTGGTAASGSDAGLLELANRVALLEASQRSGGGLAAVPGAAATAAPAGGAVASGGDCLPVGTRFMVSAGDSYPVCGTTGTVAIASVDNGYVTLSDGTVIAEGGMISLAGTQCMVGVMPGNGDGLSGYAEIRVAC